jgi:hypothetical protein
MSEKKARIVDCGYRGKVTLPCNGQFQLQVCIMINFMFYGERGHTFFKGAIIYAVLIDTDHDLISRDNQC